MAKFDTCFLGYDLDLDMWREKYDAVLAQHGSRQCLDLGTLTDVCGDPTDTDLLGFIGCCHWLNGAKKVQRCDTTTSTYGLKHYAEKMLETRGGDHIYLSQFTFEMAALHEDYRLEGPPERLHLNISKTDSDGWVTARELHNYYWFVDQPVITYPVAPVRKPPPGFSHWDRRWPFWIRCGGVTNRR